MRETKKLTAPSGKEFELKTYLTARERNELRGSLLEGVKFDTVTSQPIGDVYAKDLLEKGDRKQMEIVVVSYDGSSDKVLERIENAEHAQSAEDYDFILVEARKVGNFTQAK